MQEAAQVADVLQPLRAELWLNPDRLVQRTSKQHVVLSINSRLRPWNMSAVLAETLIIWHSVGAKAPMPNLKPVLTKPEASQGVTQHWVSQQKIRLQAEAALEAVIHTLKVAVTVKCRGHDG